MPGTERWFPAWKGWHSPTRLSLFGVERVLTQNS